MAEVIVFDDGPERGRTAHVLAPTRECLVPVPLRDWSAFENIRYVLVGKLGDHWHYRTAEPFDPERYAARIPLDQVLRAFGDDADG